MTLNEVLFPLFKAKIGSCQCCTKSPIVRYHKDDCRYRYLCELEENIRAYVRQITGVE